MYRLVRDINDVVLRINEAQGTVECVYKNTAASYKSTTMGVDEFMVNVAKVQPTQGQVIEVFPNGVSFIAANGPQGFIGVLVPGRKRTVFTIRDRERRDYEAYIPDVLIIVQTHWEAGSRSGASKLRLVNMFAFVTMTQSINMDTQLFNWPFPNVWQEGRVCTGYAVSSTDVVTIDNVATYAEHVLLNSGFNKDLSGNEGNQKFYKSKLEPQLSGRVTDAYDLLFKYAPQAPIPMAAFHPSSPATVREFLKLRGGLTI